LPTGTATSLINVIIAIPEKYKNCKQEKKATLTIPKKELQKFQIREKGDRILYFILYMCYQTFQLPVVELFSSVICIQYT
jgi:hypothetical protein